MYALWYSIKYRGGIKITPRAVIWRGLISHSATSIKRPIDFRMGANVHGILNITLWIVLGAIVLLKETQGAGYDETGRVSRVGAIDTSLPQWGIILADYEWGGQRGATPTEIWRETTCRVHGAMEHVTGKILNMINKSRPSGNRPMGKARRLLY